MTATGHIRGHVVAFDGDHWRYADTGEVADLDRPCAHCGEPPTPEGHDACLGTLPGVVSACCGHGDLERAYTMSRPAPDVHTPSEGERT